MKFAYVDESGSGSSSDGEGDIFVMAGVLIDATKLRKYTAVFDAFIKGVLGRYKKYHPEELKTSSFINGKGAWGEIDGEERQKVLQDICDILKNDASAQVYAYCLSILSFDHNKERYDAENNNKKYWHAAAMYIASLIQKKMVMKTEKNKGLTVLIYDHNAMDFPRLSDTLYESSSWYDGICRAKKGGKWQTITDENRFDQIINTAFFIKSEHSSLILVADAVAYIYRRHVELEDGSNENWKGEKDFYNGLVSKLKREKLGQVPADSECVNFYQAVKHPKWKL